MPGGMKTNGTDELSAMLGKLEAEAGNVAKQALYQGASVMEKSFNKAIRGIKTEPFSYGTEKEKRMPSPEEVEMISGYVGVARFQGNGAEVNTLVGIQTEGYETVHWNHMLSTARTNYKEKNGKDVWSGKAYLKMGKDGHAVKDRGKGGLTNRKPVGVVANSINSGTSFMQKQPFARKAVNGSRKEAQEAMEKTGEKLINEMTK